MGTTLPLQKPVSPSPLIQCLHIFKTFDNTRPVFEDARLQVNKGEFVYIIGPGGAGKSTLLRLLGGLDSPDSGHILIEGSELQRLRPRDMSLLRRRIGVIMNDSNVIMRRTVFENVALPLLVAGRNREHIAEKVPRVLGYLGLDRMGDHRCSWLSASERRRVCIARAVVNDPIILLADEPLANLDREGAERVLKLLGTLHAWGATVVFATRDESVADRCRIDARRVATVAGGKIDEGRGQIARG
jgi:cell division transport system ATP-binding protein